MFNRTAKVSKVTWKTILVNPLILGSMAIPSDDNSVLLLFATGVILVGSSVIPLGIPRVPISVSIACGIIFILGCGVSSLGLIKILEDQFPDFPTVIQWKWGQWLPSAFESLAILVWIYVVLNISPITRSLFIATVLVTAAAAYTFTSDALAIRDAIVFDVTREIANWEEGVETLLNGCAVVVWSHLIVRELASTSNEKFSGKWTLFVGAMLILGGMINILRDIFS